MRSLDGAVLETMERRVAGENTLQKSPRNQISRKYHCKWLLQPDLSAISMDAWLVSVIFDTKFMILIQNSSFVMECSSV